MPGWFKRASATGPSLDGVRFDTAGYDLQGEPSPGQVRVWHTPEGDGLGLSFFAKPPDLPVAAQSVDELALRYQKLVSDSGGKLVEVRVVDAGGLRVIRTISSHPQEPSGRTYLGSLTIPFRDFSFVLKCQCAERGDTGLKAAVLLARALDTDQPRDLEGDHFQVPGFDPDAPEHDAEFPHEPIARARRVLDHLRVSLVIADEVRRLPGFALPRGSA